MPKRLTLRQMRTLQHKTQEEVAKDLNISRRHLGKMETDYKVLKSVKFETLENILNYYGYSFDDLDYEDSKKNLDNDISI